MTRHHLPAVLIAYAVITLLTAFITLGVSKEFACFMVLSTFVGCLLTLAAQSHFAWQDARATRRQARVNRVRQAKRYAEPDPFRNRLSHFVDRHDSKSRADTESFQSPMPFRSVIDVRHITPAQPKSADLIRRTLMRIRNILRGSHRTSSRYE